jgi:hypothetical protein
LNDCIGVYCSVLTCWPSVCSLDRWQADSADSFARQAPCTRPGAPPPQWRCRSACRRQHAKTSQQESMHSLLHAGFVGTAPMQPCSHAPMQPAVACNAWPGAWLTDSPSATRCRCAPYSCSRGTADADSGSSRLSSHARKLRQLRLLNAFPAQQQDGRRARSQLSASLNAHAASAHVGELTVCSLQPMTRFPILFQAPHSCWLR